MINTVPRRIACDGGSQVTNPKSSANPDIIFRVGAWRRVSRHLNGRRWPHKALPSRLIPRSSSRGLRKLVEACEEALSPADDPQAAPPSEYPTPSSDPWSAGFIRIHFLDEISSNAAVEPSSSFVIGLSDAKVIAPFESDERTQAFVLLYQR